MAKFQETKSVILLVEDDALLNSLLKERLLEEDVHVEVCSDGKEALRKMEELQPNLVVLGLILPSLSGIEVLARMRRNKRLWHTSVLVLSQMHRKEDIQQAEAYNVCNYLVKPDHTLAELVDSIVKHIDCKPTRAFVEQTA